MVTMYTMMLITLVSTMITLTTSTCPKDMLVVYRLSLRTEWDEKIFPKQFPQWRPPAQWSKTIGKDKLGLNWAKLRSNWNWALV